MTDTPSETIKVTIERTDPTQPEGVRTTNMTVDVASLPDGQPEHQSVAAIVSDLMEQLNG